MSTSNSRNTAVQNDDTPPDATASLQVRARSRERTTDLRNVDGHEGWRSTCWILGVDPDAHEEDPGGDR